MSDKKNVCLSESGLPRTQWESSIAVNIDAMRTERLDYQLPVELIAQRPANKRTDSRLLVLGRFEGGVSDSQFTRLGQYLRKGDCLVINDTRVLPGRFYAERVSGAKLEGLFLKETQRRLWHVMLKGLRKVKNLERIVLLDGDRQKYCFARVIEKLDAGRCVLEVASDKEAEHILEEIGFVPLPPYIKRNGDPAVAAMDRRRYQTVYAACGRAVAAPTAGLHFTHELMDELRAGGVRFARVTLDVGAGTFKPVTTDELESHNIHSEKFNIDQENAEIINQVKAKGGRIIAVGTTSVRVLESVAETGSVRATQGQTRLFIKPGYNFKVVDGIVTNFHLPKSTLLALVGAFGGLDNVLSAYEYAKTKRYLFYSYGDAMLII